MEANWIEKYYSLYVSTDDGELFFSQYGGRLVDVLNKINDLIGSGHYWGNTFLVYESEDAPTLKYSLQNNSYVWSVL